MYYNGNNSIVIDNKNNLEINKILIFNVLGQKILQVKNKSFKQNSITIPFRKKEGVYLVRIESNQGKKTYKIFKR